MLFQKQKDWWCSGPTATHCSGYTPLQVCKTGAINWRVTSVSPISTEIPGGVQLLSPHPFWEPTPLQPCQLPRLQLQESATPCVLRWGMRVEAGWISPHLQTPMPESLKSRQSPAQSTLPAMVQDPSTF